MEQDDGRREWSAEIRADTRRQGGKLVSRWLREEKGSREEHDSGAVAAQAQNPTSHYNTGSSGDDVSQLHRNTSACNTSPSQPIMITRQNHSMPNLNARNNMSKPSNSNYSIPSNPFSNGLTVQSSALITKTDPPPAFNAADNTFIPLPNIADFLANNNNQPVTINGPTTDNNAAKSLTHHTLIFNSQPTKQDPPKAIQKVKKFQPGANNPALLTRPKPLPLPNPKNTQTRPEKKIN
jgi:hypothetical protein